MNTRKTLLFHHEEPLMKKNGEENFDIPMGRHDGDETCFQYIQKFVATQY